MTTGTGDSGAAAQADSFASDWQALRGDQQIQFGPVELPKPQPAPPGWLEDVFDFLGWLLSPFVDVFAAIGRVLGVSGQLVMWLLIAGAAALVAILLARYLRPILARRAVANETTPEWAPETGEALALLDDADRLAAEGRYGEATHLLLRRSVGQIAAARPGLLEPSSTAREIAALPALPEAARGAFAVIAERVERSLFALRSLSAEDWRAARAAYAEFALAAPRLA
ncbi:MAG TPA: hypothetical protein VI168_10640 [Croceibacterium sp.]